MSIFNDIFIINQDVNQNFVTYNLPTKHYKNFC